MKVEVFGPKCSSKRDASDIYSITDTKEGLIVLVDLVDEYGNRRDLKVSFYSAQGFRYLDEGDLRYYWKSDVFQEPYHVFKIISGGWSNGEKRQIGILDICSAIKVSEWFIVTTNGCLNVLSNEEPSIEFVKNA